MCPCIPLIDERLELSIGAEIYVVGVHFLIAKSSLRKGKRSQPTNWDAEALRNTKSLTLDCSVGIP
jgi:hypothetical protein